VFRPRMVAILKEVFFEYTTKNAKKVYRCKMVSFK
jgi:hypothetical protein